jgi:glycolate oxidase FAD binding subunit
LTPETFQERILASASERRPLRIRGGGSKDFYGNALQGEILDTTGYAGVVSYEPTELVITARCGTLLSDLEKLLSEQNQFLPFEPPGFGSAATLGGCIAAGLSGPRRASAGAARDFVLGAKVADGRGRQLNFGGQVMKNVAGYDVSRLLTGSLGTLGLLLEVSLKVLPKPAQEATLRLEMPEAKALEQLNRWAGQPLPVSASAWRDGELHVRLSGAASGLSGPAQKLGGDAVPAAEAEKFWNGLREQTDSYFAGDVPLWRLSVPANAEPIPLRGEQLLEWGGALRWLRSDADAQGIRAAAARAGGHATLFRARDKAAGAFSPLPPVMARIHRDLKKVFDPTGIFNPGRMYPES